MNQYETNRACIVGRVLEAPIYSHFLFGGSFYLMYLSVARLSGAEDVLPVTISERIMGDRVPKAGEHLMVAGQLRSYNKLIDGVNRLIITIFAREIAYVESESEPTNSIYLEGYVCKPVVYRTTPFSREISDILLAVNRSYNKSDYLPCIAWGRNARFTQNLEVGSCLKISGRIQSREYQKLMPDGSRMTRVAYEVSCATVEPVDR